MSLLCGTDFSEASVRAVEVAARLAAATRQPLHLVHALEPERSPEEIELRRAELGAAERGLRSLSDMARGLGANVEIHVEDGPPDEVLLDLAPRVEASLIVVGALGRRRRAGLWQVGGHAERLAQRSRVPALVVREAQPFLDWARGARPLRIVLGADASLSSERAMHWTEGLGAVGPCELTVVHLYWPPDQFERLGLHGIRSYLEPDPEVTRTLERELRARFDRAGLASPKIRTEPHLGNVGARIAAIAAEEGADLVVVGSHARSAIERLAEGSVSSHVLHHAQSSVAFVPAPAEAAAIAVPELRNVLVATDFSAAGNAAIPLAYAVAERGGRVHVVHVVKERRTHSADPHDIFAAPSAHAAERERLAKLVPETVPAGPVFTSLHVLESNDVGAAIRQAAERLDAAVICVGTHGRSGVARALLGSVAEAVVRGTRRPVLLARAPVV